MSLVLPAFLGNLGNIAGGIGAAQGIFSSLGQLFGSGGDRISNRDYQFYQDLADSGNPREIARQNEFLAGVTPANATAYNQYQDLTFQQDTDRQLDRIQDIGTATRMSPWELAGVGGASPLPSPQMGPSQGGNQATQFLSQITPLKIAEMNNQTQLQATAMNNDTAKEINAQNTAGGALPKAQVGKIQQDIKASLQGMSESQSRQTQIAADVVLKAAQTLNTKQQTRESETRMPNIEASTQFLQQQAVQSKATTANIQQTTKNLGQDFDIAAIRIQLEQNKDLREAILALARVAPTETWEIPGGSTTQIMDGSDLVKLAQRLTEKSAAGTMGNADQPLKDMTDTELNNALKAAGAVAGIVKDVAGVRSKNAVTNAANQRTYGD